MKTTSPAPVATQAAGDGLGLDGFAYRAETLWVDRLAVERIAEAVGTPAYVYSASAIRAAYSRMARAFAPLGARLHYAVKACPNQHVLRLVRGLGAGMDVVSGGELERAWLAGVPLAEVCFAGVGKTDAEIHAALDGRLSPLAGLAGWPDPTGRGPVGLFNVESASELERIASLASELGVRARAAIRINPDVDARTHAYTTTGKHENKFGVAVEEVPALFDRCRNHPFVTLDGVHAHIGSPVREIEPFEAAAEVLVALSERLERAGHRIRLLDLGGGWAVDYLTGEAPAPADYAARLVPRLSPLAARGVAVTLEPGRSILANAGILVTRVHHTKEGRATRFVVCDAGVHTLIRPALYQAFHFVWPTAIEARHRPPARAERLDLPDLAPSDVVGPVCESSDFLARSRPLPRVERGDLLAVFTAGAYGMAMASNINDHVRPAEVLVDGADATVIAERQTLADHLAQERSPRRLALPEPTE